MNNFFQSWQYTLVVLVIMILDVILMYFKIISNSDGFTLLGLVAGHYLGYSPIQTALNRNNSSKSGSSTSSTTQNETIYNAPTETMPTVRPNG